MYVSYISNQNLAYVSDLKSILLCLLLLCIFFNKQRNVLTIISVQRRTKALVYFSGILGVITDVASRCVIKNKKTIKCRLCNIVYVLASPYLQLNIHTKKIHL